MRLVIHGLESVRCARLARHDRSGFKIVGEGQKGGAGGAHHCFAIVQPPVDRSVFERPARGGRNAEPRQQ